MQTPAGKTQGRLGACLRVVGMTLLDELANVAEVSYGVTRQQHERELGEAAQNRRDAE